MCVDACVDVCIDVFVDVCIHVCIDMCIDVCGDMCIDATGSPATSKRDLARPFRCIFRLHFFFIDCQAFSDY